MAGRPIGRTVPPPRCGNLVYRELACLERSTITPVDINVNRDNPTLISVSRLVDGPYLGTRSNSVGFLESLLAIRGVAGYQERYQPMRLDMLQFDVPRLWELRKVILW